MLLLHVPGKCDMDIFTDQEIWKFGRVAVWSPDLAEAVGARVGTGSHSSYRSEVWGVISAVVIFLRDACITIYLDNEGVVDSFAVLLRPTPRRAIRATCFAEWSLIRWIIAVRRIKVKRQWIKGHSGIHRNEMAGQLTTWA
jgi:ribonuclease HI